MIDILNITTTLPQPPSSVESGQSGIPLHLKLFGTQELFLHFMYPGAHSKLAVNTTRPLSQCLSPALGSVIMEN